MPGNGYYTVGIKPCIMDRISHVTNVFYPGMFYPSTLIIMMNEVKMKRYPVKMHDLDWDFSGGYKNLTIRSDVRSWLYENYNSLLPEYRKKYNNKSYMTFVNYFLGNLFESKLDTQKNMIKLVESDFKWLQKEHEGDNSVPFEEFVCLYLNRVLSKDRVVQDIRS